MTYVDCQRRGPHALLWEERLPVGANSDRAGVREEPAEALQDDDGPVRRRRYHERCDREELYRGERPVDAPAASGT